MAYSAYAAARRRCLAVKADGSPCKCWAVWGDERQRCVAHGGRARPQTGPNSERTRAINCTCRAYAWPHRPGGGICCWPDEPEYVCTTPAGTHSWPRLRW